LASPSSKRIYYGWYVAGVSFLGIFFSLGIRYTFSIYFVAIISDMGWSRAQTAGAFSLILFVHAVLSPIVGILIDRFGPRRLFPIGALILGLSLLLDGRINSLWQLYLFLGLCTAVGVNFLSFPPHMATMARWFVRYRGLANGIAMAGIGLGGFLLAPFAQYLIDHIGWRGGLTVKGMLVICLLVPLAALIHRRGPEEVGQRPDGDPGPGHNGAMNFEADTAQDTNSSNSMPLAWTVKRAIGSMNFWRIAIVYATYGFFINTLSVHQAAKMVDAGYSPQFTATIVGAAGLFGSVGGVAVGHLSDRWGRQAGYIFGSALVIIGLIMLYLTNNADTPWMLYVYMICFGLGYGALPTLQGSFPADVFPGPFLGRILGLLAFGFGCGGALGPYLAGWLFDRTQSYDLVLLLLMGATVVGALAAVGIKKEMPT
jgi:MFS family permease